MIIVLYAIAFFLNLIEAKVESIKGDFKHYPSIIINLLTFSLIAYLLTYDLWMLFVWIGARVWFDLIYNYCASQEWHYLGSSWTDSVLRRFDHLEVLYIRILTFSITLLIVIS